MLTACVLKTFSTDGKKKKRKGFRMLPKRLFLVPINFIWKKKIKWTIKKMLFSFSPQWIQVIFVILVPFPFYYNLDCKRIFCSYSAYQLRKFEKFILIKIYMINYRCYFGFMVEFFNIIIFYPVVWKTWFRNFQYAGT